MTRETVYADQMVLPEHPHSMIDLNGSNLWVFRSDEHWDDFGWTGSPCRQALGVGLRSFPEHHEKIVHEYLSLKPQDDEAQQRLKADQPANSNRRSDAIAPTGEFLLRQAGFPT